MGLQLLEELSVSSRFTCNAVADMAQQLDSSKLVPAP
ncbi:hypothetical protein FVER14953_21346 [Fusarium verticillioides]|nr:hypothetical protein FVER14953_21346 [Fusarium verticillioides]